MKNKTNKDKQKENRKEVYRLWVEYLKESKGYKQYCETVKMRKTIPVRQVATVGWVHSLTFSLGLDSSDTDFLVFYLVFGNIHSSKYDFEKWWPNRMLKLIDTASQFASSSILFADKFIETEAEKLSKETSKLIRQGRRKIPSTFFKELLTRDFGTDKAFISIRVRSHYRTDVLLKEFAGIVAKHKKRYRITDETEDFFHNLLLPTPIAGRAVSELEDYLKVFRLRKKPNPKKYIDIAREMGKDEYIDQEGKLKEHGRILLTGYNRKANQILKNVERGIFPGKYK